LAFLTYNFEHNSASLYFNMVGMMSLSEF